MKQGFKRIVSMALIASMIATMAPSTAWAASVDNTDAAQVEAQTAADEEAVPAAESAAETEAVEVQTETEPAATEETEAQTETEETEIQTETEETETLKYGIIDLSGIKFGGANAAVADKLVNDNKTEINEDDPEIAQLRKELENVEIVGGEGGEEDVDNAFAIATYAADAADDEVATTAARPLSDEQVTKVLDLFKQYKVQWQENANTLGVQMPFYLSYNDDKDDLGVLGEMLVLAGKTVDEVRSGDYTYEDVTGMLLNFKYGDSYGLEYYGQKVRDVRDEGLAAVDEAVKGLENPTEAQKLLALNDYLAKIDSFDMAYIMNSSDEEGKETMVAPTPAQNENWGTMYDKMHSLYEESMPETFRNKIKEGLFDQSTQNALKQSDTCKDMSDEEFQAFLKTEDGKAAYNQYYPNVKADIETNGIDMPVTDDEGNYVIGDDGKPQTKHMTLEEFVDAQMDSPMDELGGATPNQAMPTIVEDAATKLTNGIVNYWEGTQFGALALGKSVCLGYSKAYAYMIQCMHPEIYLKEGTSDIDISDNWKTTDELYYAEDGKTLDINNNYVVDLVRITFDTDVTMYGTKNSGFNSDHFWNAVKVDGKWYYIDPCYTDVYTEVMSRDRGEINGGMNHMYFMFSDTSARSLYDGYYKELKTLYNGNDGAKDKSYEDSWMSRIRSNTSFDGEGNAYYSYDSTNMIGMVGSNNKNDFSSMMNAKYKIVQHDMSKSDTAGESDFRELVFINHTDSDSSSMNSNVDVDKYDAQVYNPKTNAMEVNEMLTKAVRQYLNQSSIYPSIFTSSAYYNGKVYFNISNDIFTYDLETGDVALVKEYNEVTGHRDLTEPFGAVAFSTSGEANDTYDITVNNAPIAGFMIKDDIMYVSIATNYSWVAGRTQHDVYEKEPDENGQYNMLESVKDKKYGYTFQESNYNRNYNNYKSSGFGNNDETNDNDEFMWTATITDTVDMKHFDADEHDFEDNLVTVAPTCGKNGYTEYRCKKCDKIQEGSRKEIADSAVDHHYVHYNEEYYTKDSSGNWNKGDCYVCVDCGYAVQSDDDDKSLNTSAEVLGAKDTYALAKQKAGHIYTVDDDKAITWETAEDGKVTAKIAKDTALSCKDCESKQLDCLQSYEEAYDTLTSKTTDDMTLEAKVTHDGTCDKGVTTVYTADGKVDNNKIVATKSEVGKAGEHQYTGKWTWTEVKDDNGNVTGYEAAVTDVKCSVCPDTPTADQIKVTSAKDTENSKAATCTEAGKDVYTATATVTDADGKEIGTLTADPKEVDLPALGHKYGEPKFEWAEDNKTAKATFTCENDSTHVETVDAEVTSVSDGATCTTAGKVTYTATATLKDGDKEWSGKDTKTVKVSALGHDYSDVKFNWSDDYKTATATFTCKNDSKHVETVDATVTPETTEAKCEVDGKTVYTATATLKDGDKEWSGKDTKEVKIPAIGHAYGQPEWSEWTEDKEHNTWTTTATFTCANDASHKETPTVKVTPESKDATCTVAGTVTYTATVEFGGQTYTNPQTKEVKGQPLGHDYQTTTTKATLSKDGSIVTKCTRCGDVTENTTIAYPKTITLSEDHYVYDGQEKKPEVSVVGSDGKAISADNYDVKYPESAVAGGSYDVVITFKGNYEGTVTKTFTIGQMDSELKYAKSSVTVDYKGGAVVDNAYTSKASAKDIKFTTSNKNVAAVDSEGNVTIVGPGTATITAQISGSESYKDAKAAYTVKVNSLATPAVPKVTNGKDGAVVTWTAVKNAETYSVWRKTSSTGWKKLDTVEGTTYTDKTAESNQTYYYTIRCMNAGKNICTSDYNRTGTKVYYLAPSNISSLTLTSNGIVVKWNKVAGAKSYRIYRKTTGGYTRIGTVNNGNTTSYTDTTAESGKTYTYAVKPYNGNDSADFTGKQVTYLAAPTLSTLANAANGVSLKWNSISGAQKYYIYRKEGNGGYKKIAEVKDAVSYTDKSVTSGKNYTYAVRALKGSSMSAYTGKSINYLAQANVSALNNKDNGIEVKWSKVSGAKGYYVYRKEGKNSYQKIATITNANTTSYTDTSVKNNNGKAYTYTVRAYANNALAAYTGKSVYRIATPTITAVSNSRKGEVDVDWNDVKGAKGYQIQLSSDKSFSKDTTDEIWVDYADGNGITITNCEKGDSFYFRVRAYKQNGSGTKYYSAWSTKSVKVTK